MVVTVVVATVGSVLGGGALVLWLYFTAMDRVYDPQPVFAPINEVAVGECFNSPRDAAESTAVFEVNLLDCSWPHNGELVARFEMQPQTGPYPGDDAVAESASSDCRAGFEDYVGRSYDGSDLEMTIYVPFERRWLEGDHSVQCVALPPAGETALTETVRLSRR